MLENEEFPGLGGPRYYEPALKITRDDGNRDLVLRYVSHRIQGNDLDIALRDIPRPHRSDASLPRVSGTRHPAAPCHHPQRDRAALTVESAQSATWYLPPGDGYQLSYLTGRWPPKRSSIGEPVHEGMKVLESRLGHTGHNINPWFAIDAGGRHRGERARVVRRAGVERELAHHRRADAYRQVRVTGGFNTFDFSYPLKPGETLETPAFYAGFSESGFGGASRTLHRLERERILPGGASSRLRPVLYNSWRPPPSTSMKPAEGAGGPGGQAGGRAVLMDDGWFGARNDDHAGLGDWVVNPKKFPQGLKGLIDHVNGWAWTSGYGSSRRWSTPIATCIASIPIGS